MANYFYTTHSKSSKRGCNRNVTVWQNVDNKPQLVGDKDVNSNSYKGDLTTAKLIISEEDEHKMSAAYRFEDESIEVTALAHFD